MDVYIQTKHGRTELAFMKNGQLLRYIALDAQQPMVQDILLGQIKGKMNRLQAFVVSYNQNQEALLKIKEIPAELRAKCTEGARVLLQVTKEGFKDKMPQVTMNIEYRDKYLVWKPYEKGVFLSKKISREIDGSKKELFYAWQKENGGCLIVRTEAVVAKEARLKEAATDLFHRWREHEQLVRNKEKQQILTDEWTRLQNILLGEGISLERITVDTPKFKKELLYAFHQIAIQTHLERKPLFEWYHIQDQIEAALKPCVRTSDYGLNLIIHETDAAVLIDVNSGASLVEKKLEMAVLENNKESIPIIVEQIKARNLSGVIFIDFINMKKKVHQEEIIERLREGFQDEGKDTEIYGFTALGFLEMRRTRKGKRLSEYFLTSCSSCKGSGYMQVK